MTENIEAGREADATSDPDGVFGLAVEDLRMHPGLQALDEIRTGTSSGAAANAMALPVCLMTIEVLSAADAEARGEPENAGSALSQHEAIRVARERGQPWVFAKNASIPAGMSSEQYIIQRVLTRYDLSVAQRGVLAAKLKKLLIERQEPPADHAQGGFGETNEKAFEEAARAASLPLRMIGEAEDLLNDAPDLATKVLQGKRSLHVATGIVQRRRDKTGPARTAAHLQEGLEELSNLVGSSSESGSIPREHHDRILELVQELRGGLEEQDSPEVCGTHRADAGESGDETAQAS